MTGHVLFSMNEMITQNYSEKHKALDIVGQGKSVSDVIAYDDGIIEIVVKDVCCKNNKTVGTSTYGNFVKIRHFNGLKTLYAHLKYGSVSVKKGQYIKKGQIIGRMGNTGNSYGIHLHFEIRRSNETRVNPYDYLWKNLNTIELNEVISSNVVEEIKNDDLVLEEKVVEKRIVDDIKDTEVDTVKEEIKILCNNCFKKVDFSGRSLVDALKLISVNDNYEYRFVLANKNGIDDYTGSSAQNYKLLTLLKQGQLIKAY